MAKRRGKNEGSVYYWETKKLWVAQVTLPDGKRKKKYGKTQKEVQQWLLDTRKSIQANIFVADDKATVAEFLDRWYETTVSHTLRPKTIQSYKSLMDLHIKPLIGHIRLTQLKPEHLQSLYSKKLDEGYSRRTVQYIHSVIHRALEQGVKWGMIVRNVADAVDPPRPAKKAQTVWTAEQARIFLDTIKDDRLYPLYALTIMCGLRLGEVLGLQWSDVLFETGTISIRRTIQEVSGKIVIGEPKSEKSRRSIAVPELALLALHEHRNNEREGYVFQTSNGTPFRPRNIQRHFQQKIDKAGLPRIRFHDMRHTCATLMLQQNIHPAVVQQLLGHSQIGITMDTYSHVLPTIQQKAAEKMNEIFK